MSWNIRGLTQEYLRDRVCVTGGAMTSREANKILGKTKKITFRVDIYTSEKNNPFYYDKKISEAIKDESIFISLQGQEIMKISEMPDTIKEQMIYNAEVKKNKDAVENK